MNIQFIVPDLVLCCVKYDGGRIVEVKETSAQNMTWGGVFGTAGTGEKMLSSDMSTF